MRVRLKGQVKGVQSHQLGYRSQSGVSSPCPPLNGAIGIIGHSIRSKSAMNAISARISLFYDIGNVFSEGQDIAFVGVDRQTPVSYEFDYNELKQSVGIAVQWLAPLGIFRFSYGIALNDKGSDGVRYGDETEGFQFTVGSAF